jgi:hypothetical protein
MSKECSENVLAAHLMEPLKRILEMSDFLPFGKVFLSQHLLLLMVCFEG